MHILIARETICIRSHGANAMAIDREPVSADCLPADSRQLRGREPDHAGMPSVAWSAKTAAAVQQSDFQLS